VVDQQWTTKGESITKHKFWKGLVRRIAHWWTNKKTQFLKLSSWNELLIGEPVKHKILKWFSQGWIDKKTQVYEINWLKWTV
jgi:hypothetical protein